MDLRYISFKKPQPKHIYNSITAMGCRQCLPFSFVQLKGKHCRKLHCHNGVVDTFGHRDLDLGYPFLQLISLVQSSISNPAMPSILCTIFTIIFLTTTMPYCIPIWHLIPVIKTYFKYIDKNASKENPKVLQGLNATFLSFLETIQGEIESLLLRACIY